MYTAAQYTLQVNKLILRETGTYNPMYSRPYEMQLNTHSINSVVDRVLENGGGQAGNTIFGTSFAGIACEIVRPAANPAANLNIPNGWGERRVRFLLEVSCKYRVGSEVIYYFQGYTDFPGVTATSVSPDMVFIINSYVEVSRTPVVTPMGVSYRDIVIGSGQFLYDPGFQSSLGPANSFVMRPQDVFHGMQSNFLDQGLSAIDNSKVTDTRTHLKSEPMRSSRINNVPCDYLARVINGYAVSTTLADFGGGAGDIIQQAASQVAEAPVLDNPFIRSICNVRHVRSTNCFRYTDLVSIDPNTVNDQITHIVVDSKDTIRTSHIAGQTAFWNGTGMETVASTILAQAVPAIMMDLMLTKVHFRATNHELAGQIVVGIIDAQSFVAGDLTRNYELFKQRLVMEILRDLTFNNQISFIVEMKCTMYGESVISLGFNGAAMETFVCPTFCDQLFPQVIAPTQQIFNAVVSDFDQLVNNVTEAIGGSHAVMPLSTMV